MPSLEALLRRFDERGNNKELRERTIELHSKFLEKKNELNCQIINSSDQTLEETVDEIYKAIKKIILRYYDTDGIILSLIFSF
jgi:guanylate kinase